MLQTSVRSIFVHFFFIKKIKRLARAKKRLANLRFLFFWFLILLVPQLLLRTDVIYNIPYL